MSPEGRISFVPHGLGANLPRNKYQKTIRDSSNIYLFLGHPWEKTVWKEQQCTHESLQIPNQTYVMFIWVVFLMISENRDFLDSTILSKRVCFGWKWKDGLIIGRKTRKTQLSKIVNEEVKLCGNASQTWFNKPTK